MFNGLCKKTMKPINGKVLALPACLFNLTGVCLVLAVMGAIQFGLSVFAYADAQLSVTDNIRKITLVQSTMAKPDSLHDLDKADLKILLKNPQVKRDEQVVQSWHYHGDSCALDIYFDVTGSTPDYVEFRPLSMNNDIQVQFGAADTETMQSYCLKDVLEAQGVDTPSSFARQPLPSWESPYAFSRT